MYGATATYTHIACHSFSWLGHLLLSSNGPNVCLLHLVMMIMISWSSPYRLLAGCFVNWILSGRVVPSCIIKYHTFGRVWVSLLGPRAAFCWCLLVRHTFLLLLFSWSAEHRARQREEVLSNLVHINNQALLLVFVTLICYRYVAAHQSVYPMAPLPYFRLLNAGGTYVKLHGILQHMQILLLKPSRSILLSPIDSDKWTVGFWTRARIDIHGPSSTSSKVRNIVTEVWRGKIVLIPVER